MKTLTNNLILIIMLFTGGLAMAADPCPPEESCTLVPTEQVKQLGLKPGIRDIDVEKDFTLMFATRYDCPHCTREGFGDKGGQCISNNGGYNRPNFHNRSKESAVLGLKLRETYYLTPAGNDFDVVMVRSVAGQKHPITIDYVMQWNKSSLGCYYMDDNDVVPFASMKVNYENLEGGEQISSTFEDLRTEVPLGRLFSNMQRVNLPFGSGNIGDTSTAWKYYAKSPPTAEGVKGSVNLMVEEDVRKWRGGGGPGHVWESEQVRSVFYSEIEEFMEANTVSAQPEFWMSTNLGAPKVYMTFPGDSSGVPVIFNLDLDVKGVQRQGALVKHPVKSVTVTQMKGLMFHLKHSIRPLDFARDYGIAIDALNRLEKALAESGNNNGHSNVRKEMKSAYFVFNIVMKDIFASDSLSPDKRKFIEQFFGQAEHLLKDYDPSAVASGPGLYEIYSEKIIAKINQIRVPNLMPPVEEARYTKIDAALEELFVKADIISQRAQLRDTNSNTGQAVKALIEYYDTEVQMLMTKMVGEGHKWQGQDIALQRIIEKIRGLYFVDIRNDNVVSYENAGGEKIEGKPLEILDKIFDQ